MRDVRSGPDSRCCHPVDVPYQWRDLVDPDHEAVAALEAWLQSLPRFTMLNEPGRIDELLEAAASGRIADAGDSVTTRIKPIRSDPELWELRHQALSKPLRFYHAEPVNHPDVLVKLHRHIKIGKNDQQSQIEHASRRFHLGDEVNWDPSKQPPG